VNKAISLKFRLLSTKSTSLRFLAADPRTLYVQSEDLRRIDRNKAVAFILNGAALQAE
jgi:hypothetical protein